GRLGVHIWVNKLVERLAHDLVDLVDAPALAQLGQVVAQAGHLLLVGAADPEEQLRVRRLDHVPTRNEAVPVERAAKRERTRLGKNRLVKVEESGTTKHGRQV